ncbi:endonuclease/exonuclease/phosphatase family protein [Citricoccus muralis]|uniref:Endonuclease/exonuclease/phosphatase family protein n=1 Tax=Citricoccus muralis TaxID=169134 RepID=A0ABY8H6S1_9MICC|nr:endonuclease/exonuclease/phosphatase family protein [Citricoccus muralis]WFP16839.1 endonuclease/exonuclease/phosphatase family protein [Citricoccus muralis]
MTRDEVRVRRAASLAVAGAASVGLLGVLAVPAAAATGPVHVLDGGPVHVLDGESRAAAINDVCAPEASTGAGSVSAPAPGSLRVATFHSGLSRDAAGDLIRDLSAPGDAQGAAIAETVQRAAPEVLVLSGFDVDDHDEAATLFATNYLAVGQQGQQGIDYPYIYSGPVNAGIESGADLDDDGVIGGPGDALGYGDFPGQSGMVIFSTEPIDTDNIRTFQDLRWEQVTESHLPADKFTSLEQSILPLSSVGHWDVPITVGNRTVHVLASAPADASRGTVDQARNADEIGFWSDYVTEGQDDYIVDDAGATGGLSTDDHFVVAGTLGADPDGCTAADPAGINELLDTERITDLAPEVEPGTGSTRTTESDDRMARADYVLPSDTLDVRGSGVFWPGVGEDGSHLTGSPQVSDGLIAKMTQRSAPTDHRLVWADIVPAP